MRKRQHQSVLVTSSLCCDLLLLRNLAFSNCIYQDGQWWICFTGTSLVDILIFALFLPKRAWAPFPCVTRYWLDLTSSDILWNTSDTGWAKASWSSVFSPWIQGACVFVHKMPRFDPNIVFEVSEESLAMISTVLSGWSRPVSHFPSTAQGQHS